MQQLLVVMAALTAASSPVVGPPVDYAKQIKPILARRCYACHGALKQEANLRLDTAPALLAGGDSGPAAVLGQSRESLLVEAITGDLADWRMPPEGEPLAPEEIRLLEQWIDAGAPHSASEVPPQDPRSHWSFQPLSRPRLPVGASPAWMRNEIDAFVAARQQELGLTPVREARKEVLLRRVYLDLIGLPPTRAQLHAFYPGRIDDRLRACGGHVAGEPSLRRALGATLDGHLALQ